MTDILISKLNFADWQTFKEISLASLQSDPDAYKHTWEEMHVKLDEYWKGRLNDGKRFFLVAMHEGIPVGLSGGAYDKIDTSKAIIMSVFVKKEYRGQGLGKRLVEATLKYIKDTMKINKVKLWVSETQKTAQQMYEKMGFMVKGVDETVVVGDGHKTFVMEKETI